MNTDNTINLRNRTILVQPNSKIPVSTNPILRDPKPQSSTTSENISQPSIDNQEQKPEESIESAGGSTTPNVTEIPQPSDEKSLRERLRASISDTTNLVTQLTSQTNPIEPPEMTSSVINEEYPFNKGMADMMNTHIPKFELNPNTDPALELRSFLRACENVINLFDPENEETPKEFFQLIKLRLGYNVQERITKTVFKDLKDLEDTLRSVCHIKLNKGKLLSEIRNEYQHPDEDVSHFVERLRKLIAQGRSEYPKDKDFEYEAIRTLKNSVKNELISIKLMDSAINVFEDLADVAITRDSELNQREHNKTLHKNSDTNELMNELLKKIKKLETAQSATVQNITQANPIPGREPNQSPQINRIRCNYCKKPGHLIDDCRIRLRTNNYPNQQRYNPNGNPNRFRQNYQPNPNNRNPPRPYNPANSRPVFNPNPQNRADPALCLRCNQPGHKSPNCYAIICSTCNQIGHLHNQCTQSNRRVHFCEHTQSINENHNDHNLGNT